MQEKVDILTAEQYFKRYGDDAIGKGADRWMVKRQLIDAFRRETFGLITMRLKKTVNDLNDIPEGDPEALRITRNVIHDTTMKWKKLCKLFDSYMQTANLLKPNDLKLFDEIEEEETDAGTDTGHADNGEGRDTKEMDRPDDDGDGNVTEEEGSSGTGGYSRHAQGYPDRTEEEAMTNAAENTDEVATSGYVAVQKDISDENATEYDQEGENK